MLLSALMSVAQENGGFEKFNQERQKRFADFNESRQRRFNEFRRLRNEEFAKILRGRWKDFKDEPVIKTPQEDDVPPVVIDDDKVSPPSPQPLPYDEVIDVVVPKPQPVPIDPIEELPEEDNKPTVHPTVAEYKCSFTYFGTPMQVRIDKDDIFSLKGINENGIADAWLELSGDKYVNLIHDCLKLRTDHKLCDWAYLLMLEQMANAVCGVATNEATMLMAYVYCQSGYSMRMGIIGNRLRMLFSSEHIIYGKSYYILNGKFYYIYGSAENRGLRICEKAYPKEQDLSLYVTTHPGLAVSPGKTVIKASQRYPDMRTSVSVNTNLLEFYNTYPTSMAGGNMMTRWAMYANSPLDEHVKEQIYPVLRSALQGCDELTAVNKILNYVQTGFEYGYDDKVWGGDRAFFSEETLHYPYSDCEDHSILFTRLVRDLLDLKCILIYYPGHLASAVCFGNKEVNGDYILLDGKKYTVCDATYIGAGVGLSMPNVDSRQVKVILLE